VNTHQEVARAKLRRRDLKILERFGVVDGQRFAISDGFHG